MRLDEAAFETEIVADLVQYHGYEETGWHEFDADPAGVLPVCARLLQNDDPPYYPATALAARWGHAAHRCRRRRLGTGLAGDYARLHKDGKDDRDLFQRHLVSNATREFDASEKAKYLLSRWPPVVSAMPGWLRGGGSRTLDRCRTGIR